MVTHTRIPFSDLVFLDDNPRTRTPEGLRQMAADIQADPTFFENRPVLVNLTAGTHQVYAGDLRAHAAHDVLGWADIPCIVERDVPPDVMRRRAIIDNLHRETWAPDILTSSWATDDLEGWGLTPDKWGDAADTPDTPAGGYTASEDDYEPPPEIVTDIVPGDLFEIGPHRLLCGDSTDSDAVARLMDGEKANAVLTDPPYGQNQPGVTNDSPEDHSQILKDCISILPIENAVIVAFNSPRTFPAWLIPCIENGHKFERMFWLYKKAQNAYPFRGWLLTSEAILVSSVGKPNWNDVHPYVHDCYEVSEVSGKLPEGIGWHGSVKPVKIVGDLCSRISFEKNIILDPFLGSGTTMVAAHQLNRRCYGIEIDPKYCQVILDRMLKLDPTLTITRNGKPYTTA